MVKDLIKKFRKTPQVSAPIFIVGCGHSGTSLILAILDSHSHIWAVPEESGIFSDHPEKIASSIKAWNRMAVKQNKRRWVEKTPRHIRHIPKILESCPNAKIIIVLRDGRDVVCSLKARLGDLEKSVRRWVKDNQKAESFWAHPQVFVLKYEDVIASPKETLRAVFEFLEEPFEESVLEFHQKSRQWYSDAVEKPSGVSGEQHQAHRNWQINQPMFDGRKKWMQAMEDEEKAYFKERAGAQLIAYGYADDNNW